jgi:hypothetical protein
MLKYRRREQFGTRNIVNSIVMKPSGSVPSWSPPFALEVPITFATPPLKEFSEEMVYDDDPSPDLWKPVQHIVRRLDFLKASKERFHWSSRSITDITPYLSETGIDPIIGADPDFFPSSYGVFGEHSLGLPSMSDAAGGLQIIGDPPELGTLIGLSLKAMLPSLRSELSLINSILELKDFRSLPQTIRSVGSFANRLSKSVDISSFGRLLRGDLKSIRRTFSRSLGPTAAEGLRVGADAYLQKEFNILPLLSDITGIARALSKLRSRLNDLLNRRGKRQLRHFTRNWYPSLIFSPAEERISAFTGGKFSGYTSPPDTTGIYTGNVLGCKVKREVILDQPAVFHAEIEYNFDFTRYQIEHAQLFGLLDSLGVDLDPRIIWNAIPWSFVVDWLIGVNQWLGRRRVLNMDPKINITRYLWSWKQSRTVRCSYWSYQTVPSGNVPIPVKYLPDLVESIYRRDVGIPDYSYLLGSGLDSHEFSLGVALAITQTKRPRNRRYIPSAW